MWPDLAGRLVDGGHRLPIRVYFEDTDFSGIVYHGAYVRFIERGRSDFLRLAGVLHADLAAGGYGEALTFAVRALQMEFLRPARIDDLLVVVTRLEAVSGARVVLHQQIEKAGEIVVDARVTVAVLNGAGQPRRLPALARSRMLAVSTPPSGEPA
jgi:acyl-CoA thioester hydrolase